jgi:Domain of unknown function (DUF4389)
MTTATGETPASYPVRLEVLRPASQSRLTNFPLGIGTFIRLILLVPHLIILYFLQIVASIIYLIATFAILFTGRYPRGMFSFYVGYTRWSSNTYGYLIGVYDNYPAFSMDEQPGYPLSFSAEYPEKLNRLLNFPFLGLIIKLILLIPHFIVLYFLVLVAFIVLFIAQFAILFTGSFPEGMHKFMIGVGRWSTRVNAYAYALTDQYPPFSLS